jgi:NADPH2:quinone reductase
MPHAVIGREFGPPESYRLEEYDPGPPKRGEVRVAIRAAGVSFVDVLTAMGQYQFKPPLPFIPGSEFAGTVVALGEDVTNAAVGDRVFGSSMGSVFTEISNFGASHVRIIPEGVTFEEASVFPVNYMTAYHALVDRGRLKPGETLLVLGAAGGTGYAAIQMGKYLGARVIASASTEEKRKLALAGGADAVVVTGAQDWREQVKAANQGRPIDVIFDGVGGDATELAFRTLGYDGRHLVVGFPAGIASLKTNLALLKSASLVGVHMRHFSMEHPNGAAANSAAVFDLVRKGVLKPAIAKRYPIAGYVEAMNEAFSGKTAGRVVLIMN